jgi:hypothetical protein
LILDGNIDYSPGDITAASKAAEATRAGFPLSDIERGGTSDLGAPFEYQPVSPKNAATTASGMKTPTALLTTGLGVSSTADYDKLTSAGIAVKREKEEEDELYRRLFERSLGAVPVRSGGLMKLAGGGMSYMEAGGTTGPTGAPRDVVGTGDGMSDSVPADIEGVQEARLADGEFVIPADVVADIGNGSSDAGSKKLYDMMDRVRMARHDTTRTTPRNQGRAPDACIKEKIMAQVGQVAISSDIPSALKDFYTGTPEKPEAGLIPRAVSQIFPEGLTGADAYAQRFQPLIEQGLVGAGTIAPMSQFQQGVGTQLAGMTMPDQFALGEQSGQASAAGLQALLGVQAPEFGSAQALQYMSPYMQNVVDAQQRQAIDAARQSQLSGNLAAARQGTYGGARQALLQSQRESGLRTQLGDIRAQGLQRAYEQAQQQFERDRTAGFEAGRQRQAAATGLGGLAQIFGGLGTQQLAGELDVLKTQGAFGDLQRSVSQQQMDAQRGALQDQAQYGMTQVGQLSNLLRGIPLSDTTQTTTTPPPSFASQLTGLGLTGVGLYNLLGGGK